MIIGKINSLLLSLSIIFSSLAFSVLRDNEIINFNVLVFICIILFIFLNAEFHYWAFFICLLIIISILFSVYNSIDILHPGGYNSALFTIVMYIMFSVKSKSFDMRLFSGIITLFLIIVGVLSLYFWFEGIYFSEYYIEKSGIIFDAKIATGIFYNSNTAGVFFLVGMFLSLLFIRSRLLKLILGLLFAMLNIFSFCRGSVLAMFVGLLLYVILKFNYRIYIKFLKFKLRFYKRLLVIIRLVLLLFFILFFFTNQIDTIMYKITSVGVGDRFELISLPIEQSTEHLLRFILGLGPNLTLINGQTAHNSFVNEFSNYGFIFIIFSLIFIIGSFVYALRKHNYNYILFLAFALTIGLTETVILATSTPIWTSLIVVYHLPSFN